MVSFDNAEAAAGLWLDLLPEGVAVKETVGELRRGSRRSVARRDWKRGRSLAVRLLRVEGMGHAWSGGAAGQAPARTRRRATAVTM